MLGILEKASEEMKHGLKFSIISRTERWSLFPFLLNLGWPCDQPKYCGRRNAVLVLGLA